MAFTLTPHYPRAYLPLKRSKQFASKNIRQLIPIFLLLTQIGGIKCLSVVGSEPSQDKNLNNGQHLDDNVQNVLTSQQNQEEAEENLNRHMFDQMTTNNPCLIHYCPKGRECIIDTDTNNPICICQRYCSHRKRTICGSDGNVYANHCELHRASCIAKQSITYQRMEKCQSGKDTDPAIASNRTYLSPVRTVADTPVASMPLDASVHNEIDVDSSQLPVGGKKVHDSADDLIRANRKDYCSSQEYEIMKDNLLLYSHARLMTQENNHSKDFLVSLMFSHYDQNNNAHLEVEELNEISMNEHLEELSNGCILADMLNFDDTNHDGKLSINEFYQAFSKLYSVFVVSLDKALETNQLSARVGDNVEIKCDVTGSPSPPLIWLRNGIDLSFLNEDDIRVFNDGSLYLTRVQLYHGGNYTCHAQRNKDVVQTHVLQIYTVPEVRVMPRIQSKRPGENSEMSCHITGDPFPWVEWLKNDEVLNFSTTDKYQIIGNGTSLRINNIVYSDTGAYMCQARNIGGSVRDISSLIVQEEPTPTVLNEDKMFFVFHEQGVAIYEPAACRLHHQILGTHVIPGTQEYVCGDNRTQCVWGRAHSIGPRYIYASQPLLDRVLVISTIQMVVVDVIPTDKYPVELYYVAQLDQVWVLNWRDGNTSAVKTLQVIRDAGQKRKHHAIHPEPIDGQFDVVKDFFIPSNDLEQPHYTYKYGYVSHQSQRGLYKLDLANLRYSKSVDLTMHNCVPDNVVFSSLYGLVIISCREPLTDRPQGQLVLDYLTDAVLTTKPTLFGDPYISPDCRHLATIEHRPENIRLVIQKITPRGLEFLFDVKTSLNISDATFYESQSMHGYDLFATATDKDDILYINLFTGKVEIITGVGMSMPTELVQWNNPVRMIRSSGLFGQYMVTPANNALYVLNGKARTVNCEIGVIIHPVAVVWVHSISPSYLSSTTTTNLDTKI